MSQKDENRDAKGKAVNNKAWERRQEDEVEGPVVSPARRNATRRKQVREIEQ